MFALRSGSSASSRSASGGAPVALSVEALRRRARQRLMGAAVLVLAAVIGLPWLLESQPRPVPVDIAIEIPSRDNAAPLQPPAPRTESAPSSAAAMAEAPSPAPSVPPTAAERTERPAPVAENAPASPPTVPAATAAEPARPLADAAAKVRVVVQVGAFADPVRAQEVRQRLERAGLKTYIHVAETPEGKRTRVRVGPFDSRAEAEKVAEKVKGLGLPAAVLTL